MEKESNAIFKLGSDKEGIELWTLVLWLFIITNYKKRYEYKYISI
jgi:hypothetical protein